jgi:hypothetical protein
MHPGYLLSKTSKTLSYLSLGIPMVSFSQNDQLTDDERLRQGLIDGATWRARYRERQTQLAASGDALKASPAYQDVPINEAEWNQYRERFEIPEGYTHPIQEVLNRYYAVDADKFVNPETGETDWDSFFTARENAIAYADPETRQVALEWAHRRDTPMVAEYRKAQTVLRDYWQVYDDIKADHPDWARVVEDEERETDPEQALALRQTAEYKAFTQEVTKRRQTFRKHNPEIEFYLFLFGYITNLTNPQALELVRNRGGNATTTTRLSRLLSR